MNDTQSGSVLVVRRNEKMLRDLTNVPVEIQEWQLCHRIGE